jgi:chemotaxis protein methyltransferase CheR
MNYTPIVPAECQVSEALLLQYAALIYERTGIRISKQKRSLLSNRVRRRLRETKIADFEAYFRHLKSLKPTDPEWDGFLQEITTHETYLFRDDAHWNWLQNQFLPQFLQAARTGAIPKKLRVWSAACSTGDEAYTIACCVANALPSTSGWDLKIVGTDIGIETLQQAKRATFCARAMRMVPIPFKTRFFQPLSNERWQANAQLQSWIDFRLHNLMQPFVTQEFDLVFLKNVLIYFDDASKAVVLKNIRTALKPGGLLVAGAAEGITDLVRDFERIQPWLYRWRG